MLPLETITKENLFLQARVIQDARKSVITTIEDPTKEKYFIDQIDLTLVLVQQFNAQERDTNRK